MNTTEEKLLEVNGLRVSFFTPAGEIKAVDAISYSLKHGEVLGIVGESGSGKSVEAYSILGILEAPGRVIGGSVKFEGKEILGLSRKEMEKIRGNRMSMIFQNPMESLNPVWTIGNQLVDVLLEHAADNGTPMRMDEAYRWAVKMLNLVGINNAERRMKQYPHELSGGMRQRVMIAMGLICEPQLLIADEPTTALDVTIQAQILELMKQIQEKNRMSIIFITHNLAAVAEICDTVVVMYGGHLVESGSVEEIFYQALHPYTRGLLRSMPRLDEEKSDRLIPIEGTPINMLEPNPGCPFAPRCECCMKICLREVPEETQTSETHRALCWLLQKEDFEKGKRSGT